MATACDVYKNHQKIGSGQASAGSKNITSYTYANANSVPGTVGRFLTFVLTAGASKGQHWHSRVVTDGGTLVLRDPCPFTGA